MATLNQAIIALHITLTHWFSVCASIQRSEAFTVNRGDADRFLNPDCDDTTCPNVCYRYDAVCYSTEDYNPCKYCECNESLGKRTFVGNGNNGGGCVSDADLVTDSVPKEKVIISSHLSMDNAKNKCLFVDVDLILQEDCFTTKEYSWIYTKDNQFVSLNTLSCLTAGPENNAMVSPCKLSGKKQQWYCDVNGTLIYREKNGSSNMYIDGKLNLTDSNVRPWKKYKMGKDHSTLCQNPVEYKGCYRFTYGSFVRYLEFNPTDQNGGCPSKDQDCFTTIHVLAPIYEENTKCLIDWENSSYLINNKQWQLVPQPDNDITVFDAKYRRGIYVKIPYTSYEKWSESVLRIEVKCSSETTSEEHCVLIKFPGGKQHKTSTQLTDEDRAKSRDYNPYKISTIVLAILVVIILVWILAYFVIHKKVFKKLIRQNPEREGAEMPICELTDDEPQM